MAGPLAPRGMSPLRPSITRLVLASLVCVGAGAWVGCGDDAGGGAPAGTVLQGTITFENGGRIEGSGLEGYEAFALQIGQRAVRADTTVYVVESDLHPLPSDVVAVGPTFALLPEDIVLDTPALLSVPFDSDLLTARGVSSDFVEVYVLFSEDDWQLAVPVSRSSEAIMISVTNFRAYAPVIGAGP